MTELALQGAIQGRRMMLSTTKVHPIRKLDFSTAEIDMQGRTSMYPIVLACHFMLLSLVGR
jgi:hypothetical protein